MVRTAPPSALPPVQERHVTGPHGPVLVGLWDGGGTGAPMVLLHDSLGSVALWRDFPARLAAATGRRVLAYDRAGYGRSVARRDPLIAPDFVAGEAAGDFAAVTAALGIGDFVVLGHSIGGSMAIEIAATLPDRCRALISVDAQVFPEATTLAGIRLARAQFARPEVFARLARYHGDRTQWALDGWIGNWLGAGFAGWSQDDSIRRVSCPFLVIHGAEDEYGGLAHPRRIAANATVPAQVCILPGADHFPHRSQPQPMLAVIARFLKDTP